jgi:hypothetical protein
MKLAEQTEMMDDADNLSRNRGLRGAGQTTAKKRATHRREPCNARMSNSEH